MSFVNETLENHKKWLERERERERERSSYIVVIKFLISSKDSVEENKKRRLFILPKGVVFPHDMNVCLWPLWSI